MYFKFMIELMMDRKCQICKGPRPIQDCLKCHEFLHDNLHAQVENVIYKNATLRITFSSYRKVKKFIELGKYKLNKHIFDMISKFMFNQLYLPRDCFVTFVPSNFKTDQQKGYNPSYEVAKNIATKKNLPYFGLLGAKNIQTQVKLSREERVANVKNKFFLKSSINLNSYNVCVIVDDVITTGATMMAITDLLSEQYPHLSVIWLSIAK